MRNNIQKLLALLFILSSLQGFANNQVTEQNGLGIFDALNFQEVVEVNLEMDINAIISDRRNVEKHPAIFSFLDENGNQQTWNIKVNLRGKFRRSKCAEMPPLKLNFKKSDLKEKGFASFDDFKLVTQCVEDEEIAKELLLKEYLAYKLFNQLSEESFRVQLLKINYIDSKSNDVKNHWAFLIEDTAQMRNRLSAEKVSNSLNNKSKNFDAFSMKKMALFQYMIGNLDYDIAAARNIKLVKKADKLVAIPYDFDFSFFVNAPYLTVGPQFKVTTISDRVYLGFEEDLKNIEAVKDLFQKKKNSLYKIVRRFKWLDRKERSKILFYLDTFFDNINTIHSMPRPMLVGEN